MNTLFASQVTIYDNIWHILVALKCSIHACKLMSSSTHHTTIEIPIHLSVSAHVPPPPSIASLQTRLIEAVPVVTQAAYAPCGPVRLSVIALIPWRLISPSRLQADEGDGFRQHLGVRVALGLLALDLVL